MGNVMEEHEDSLFAPANALKIKLGLEALIGINIVTVQIAVLVYLIYVAGPLDDDVSALEAAVDRSREKANLFSRIFMLSGIFFFSLFFLLSTWLYRGVNRLKWFLGGLGVLAHSATLVAWKVNLSATRWYLYLIFLLIATCIIVYAILFALRRAKGMARACLCSGVVLVTLGMPTCYVVDKTGIAAVVIQGVGLAISLFSYIWIQTHRESLKAGKSVESEPLLN